MNLLGNFFLFLCLIAALILIGLAILSAGAQVVKVPQEQRLVIYRLGRFKRLAGPGLETLSRFDSIERTINIRSEFKEYLTATWYFNGLPITYTISLWSSNDLAQACGDDRKRLERLVQYSDAERQRYLRSKLNEALYHSRPVVEQKYAAASTATVSEQLLPMLPGMPGCNELMQLVRKELRATLPSIGVILDEEHEVTVTEVQLAPEVIAGLERSNSLKMLREQFPHLTADELIDTFSAIEGFNIRKMRLQIESSADVRDIEFDGETIERFTVSSAAARVQEQPAVDTPLLDHATLQAKEDKDEERLTRNDLSILKRLA